MIERRKALGLNQKQAAEKAGASVNAWGRWESAVRLPRAKVWPAIAKALDVTLARLQREAGKALNRLGGEEHPGARQEKDPATGVGTIIIDTYTFCSSETENLEKYLNNVDLHKLHQSGWHYHMEHWRTQQRQIIRAADLLMQSLREQADLFVKLHHILLGNESGRILPIPKYQPGMVIRTRTVKPGGGPQGGGKKGGGKNKKRR